MPAFKILFTSRRSDRLPLTELPEWVRQNAIKNRNEGVTGLLFHKDGDFLHLLEGGREAVETRFESLRRDPGLEECRLLQAAAIFMPRCRDWGMLHLESGDWGVDPEEYPSLPENAETAQHLIDAALRTYRDRRQAA